MDEENQNQEEQKKQAVQEEIQNQAAEKAKKVAIDKLKNSAVAAQLKKIAIKLAIVGIQILSALLILSVIIGLFLVAFDWFLDLFVSETSSELTNDLTGEYCYIDNKGIHFRKEEVYKVIEQALQEGGIDYNDLGLGNDKTTSHVNGETEGSTAGTDPYAPGQQMQAQHTQAEKYLYEFLTASLTTEFPYIEGSDKETQGIIKIKRKSTGEEAKDLKFIGYEDFTKMLESTNRNEKEKAKDYFSLDQEWNLCVAKSYKQTVNGKETQYDIIEVKIPYRAIVSQYSTPFSFLMNLLLVTHNPEYVQAVTELISTGSQIEFTIFDSITTTTHVYTYKHSNMRRYKTTSTSYQGIEHSTYTTTGPTEQPDEVTTTVTEETTLKANVTMARTWAINQVTDYIRGVEPTEYLLGEDGQTNTLDNQDEITGNNTGTWHVDRSENTKISIDTSEWIKSGDTNTELKVDAFMGLWKNSTGKYIPYYNKDVTLNLDAIENLDDITSLDDLYIEQGVVNPEALYNPDGKLVEYLLPNSHTWDRPVLNIVTSEGQLIGFFEENMITQSYVEIMRYMIQLYKTGEKLDISDIFTLFEPIEFVEMGSMVGGDYVVKTDESSAAPIIEEKEKFKEVINKWLRTSSGMKTKALKISDLLIDLQEEYQVNAIFMLGLLRAESGIGTADSSFVNDKNNWTSWGTYSFNTPEENIRKTVEGIATGKFYFKQGYISVYSIGAVYCTDPPPPRWAQEVAGYMSDIYSILGIGEGIEGTGDVTTYTIGNKKYINYKQGAYKERDVLYSATGSWGTIADKGCMPTSIAIIASGYGKTSSNGQIYNPRTIITDGILPHTSTYGNAVRAFQRLGLSTGPQTYTSSANVQNDIIQHLKLGKPILIHATKGYYTGGGHLMTLLGINSAGEVYLSNPESESKTGYISLSTLISRKVDWYAKVDV